MIPGLIPYAIGSLVVVAALVGSHEIGFSRAKRVGAAQLASYQAQAEAEAAKLRAKSAEVRVEVVTKYVDRVKTIRVPEPVEVVREIEIIRQSDCKLPANWVRLHDAATSDGSGSSPGTDDAAEVSCAAAIEGIRENYKRFHENAAQLEALQKWAASVSEPRHEPD